jgi:hypothetical protein
MLVRSIVSSISVFCVALLVSAQPARAISPQNPYRSFNLSGINYGSMQWERAQREGRRVWPYFNAPAPSRGVPTMSVGGFGAGGGGAVVRSAAPSARRGFRRWRR